MADRNYHEELNKWHLELAIASEAVAFLVSRLEESGLISVGSVVSLRLEQLVESCPFPSLSPSRGGKS